LVNKVDYKKGDNLLTTVYSLNVPRWYRNVPRPG